MDVYNQTGPASYVLLGSLTLTVTGTPASPGVDSITPDTVDVTAPPASFTVAGFGFADTGFGLTVANFVQNGVFLGQVRATAGNSTSITLPFPT